ncbi:MAG TPA: DUF3793 family protein [Methylomusa anaerophila]|uniref:DUF3793 domain-containing protein n=1 Tax=Methylomusa anaerophila TaxID=1930071 RepID=A0A348AGZ6_9FIRM|nr:DUF3793 family protein [Methylomusa anaerophila]BBB90344.1 hypothetical protein MAMMFC1_00992 [Methylomusa anaerophila]HML89310.1 DUF3793 family protein [Methylomusa anaerophila]
MKNMHTGETLLKGESRKCPAYFFRWLVVELAPTIHGYKPATLLSLSDSFSFPRLSFWQQYGPGFLRRSGIEWVVLRECARKRVILFYRPQLLEEWLKKGENCRFLAAHGYKPECSLSENMAYLKKRYQGECPHEIGLWLGIPLKDVLGFMGISKEYCSCKGLWCIYGDPELSLTLMRKINDSKRVVAEILQNGVNPHNILLGYYEQTA